MNAAEVHLTLWEEAARDGAGEAPGSRERAARALSGLFTCSLTFAPAKPPYHRLRGWERWLRGAKRRAVGSWERALEAAVELRMPYEEARARVALARAEPRGSAARRAQLDRAEALFAEMSCSPDVAAVRALRRSS
jgi:hypothetical protein